MKKIRLFLAVICVAFCLATTFYVAQSTPVLAASSTSSTKKVDASKLKIKLSATTYNYNGKEKKPTVSVTYKGKKVSSDYYKVKFSSGRKLPGTYSVTVTFKGKYTGKKTLTYKIIIQSPTVKTDLSTKSIGLSWNKTTKASRYIVYNSSKKQIAKIKGTSYTIENLKPGTKYTFYVRSYAKIGDKAYYSSYVKVQTSTKPAISGSSSMYVGATKTFTATVSSKAKVTWSSSDKNIATVSSSGKVTAIKAGTVTIKAKANGVTASYKVKIKTPTIKLNKSNLTIKLDETATLKATTTPSSMKVKWKSSNTDVLEVSSKGKLTPVSVGTATVTATGTYGGKSYKKTCKVTVELMDILTVEYVDWTMDSVGGISPEITLTNNTEFDIKYIKIYTSYKNKFGDPAYCEIYDDDTAKLNVQSGLYAHETKTFYWDVVLYNEWVSRVDVDAVEITFVDNTVITQEINEYWYDSNYYKQ